MKKALMLAAAFLLTVSIAGSATRESVQVPFRFALANGTANPTYSDSFTVRRAGSRTDTTRAFNMPNWAAPRQASAAVDSIELFTVLFGPADQTTVTVGSGTTTLGIQGSLDGTNWVTLSGWVAIPLTATGTGNYLRMIRYSTTTATETAFPFFRLIVVSAATGRQQLYVSYPRE